VQAFIFEHSMSSALTTTIAIRDASMRAKGHGFTLQFRARHG
jgi:hypothetical protein